MKPEMLFSVLAIIALYKLFADVICPFINSLFVKVWLKIFKKRGR